ncbi:putative leucine-rich repeat domain, L domain-containing protein [Medicago truncatula]|uniref:Putative leucine-rich repeat domain, L domain-containing protein n=1 Tax=Medicago truncatula TaxID=3880 RepID=A0A396HY58_MEDTR|nr:putative leucine-rich repeat domain, L domain-containing protein [Medicago truncatula]
MNIRVLKLEVLSLIDTRVYYEALHVISKSCCRLLQLLLQNCEGITKMGVKHVVKNCTQPERDQFKRL